MKLLKWKLIRKKGLQLSLKKQISSVESVSDARQENLANGHKRRRIILLNIRFNNGIKIVRVKQQIELTEITKRT